jgi:hypothetical protein
MFDWISNSLDIACGIILATLSMIFGFFLFVFGPFPIVNKIDDRWSKKNPNAEYWKSSRLSKIIILVGLILGGATAYFLPILIFGDAAGSSDLSAIRLSVAYHRLTNFLQSLGLSPFWRAVGGLIYGTVWIIGGIVSCVQFIKFIGRNKNARRFLK